MRASRRGVLRGGAAFAFAWGLPSALVRTAYAQDEAQQRAALIGEIVRYRVSAADTFSALAPELHVGYVELLAANPGINPWLPGGGTEIVLPTAHILPDAPHEGIVINLAELRLYFFPADGAPTQTYALGIGRAGWETPLGRTTVRGKTTNPGWTPPASLRAENPALPAYVPPGPNNPLGAHAIYLGWDAYLIHGTNLPKGVGRRVSHGCIRMYPPDVALLYDQVGRNTPVTVVDQPAKAAWHDGDLYLEVHPTLAQINSVEIRETPVDDPLPVDIQAFIEEAAGDQMYRVDRHHVGEIARQRTGIPIRVTVPSKGV